MPGPQSHLDPLAESLADLVARVADRDRAAFGRLYRRLVRPVFAQARASLGSSAEAVPVTRAVFVEVWRLAPVSRPRHGDVLAWVTGIVARRTGDRLREPARPPAAGYDGHLGRELMAALGPESPGHPAPR